MSKNLGLFLTVLVVLLVVLSGSLFTVDQRQSALVFQLGEVVSVKTKPGLYFKLPLVQNVRYFDTRILTLDTADPERFITSEKKNVLVDSFIKWRVVDPKQFYVSVGGDESRAAIRLNQAVNDGLRAEFGKRTINDVVSGGRDEIMSLIRAKADQDARKIGVEVVDVRIKRVDLPESVSENVYRRMEAERKQVANELRSTGAAEAEKIKADADKQKDVIVAEAYRDAQRVKGEGDARATAIYARAFSENPEFYASKVRALTVLLPEMWDKSYTDDEEGYVARRNNMGHKSIAILGSQPLMADGSVRMQVPCETPLLMIGTDPRGLSLAHDEMLHSLRQGETRTCHGCHDGHSEERARALGAPALEREWARAARDTARATGRYRWLGALSGAQARALIRRARVLLHPSRAEGGATVIAEALQSGTPVIASDCAGNVGLLGRDYPGLFPVGDSDSARAMLLRAESEPAFYRRLLAAARRRARLFAPAREGRSLRRLVHNSLQTNRRLAR